MVAQTKWRRKIVGDVEKTKLQQDLRVCMISGVTIIRKGQAHTM